MGEFFHEFLNNKVIWIGVIGWAIAQGLKVLLGVLREKRFDFRWFVGTGGMPSAHSSGVSAFATAVGLKHGWSSTFFAIAFVVAFITMFDAQGVRRAAGKQAAVLNKIVDELYLHGKISEGRLWELLGHTPFEVFVGFVIGVSTALILAHYWGVS